MNWSILRRSKTKRLASTWYGRGYTQEINTHNKLLVFVTHVYKSISTNQVWKHIVNSAVDILYSWITLLHDFGT